MIVGIDFDRVLFDTDAFDRELKESVEGMHHTEEEPYDENGNYSPEIHAEILGIDADSIYDAAAEIASSFLYPDAARLEQVPCEVVIVTRGEEKFQRIKVENSGVLGYVDSYIVIEDGDKELEELDMLVDDREEELDGAEIPTFLFDRKENDMEDIVEWVEQREA
ncbi:MAG: hypothetical protein ABEJ07_02045 [Candidatus Nanohaloarchaea archaeon]